jgi:hypothetical protein
VLEEVELVVTEPGGTVGAPGSRLPALQAATRSPTTMMPRQVVARATSVKGTA